ncbi:hypothetical protein F3K43_38655 [Streptomyces sp. LBUM 1476]|nr:hypothetical protein [Streptomyces sp. LBUM 1476]
MGNSGSGEASSRRASGVGRRASGVGRRASGVGRRGSHTPSGAAVLFGRSPSTHPHPGPAH